MSRFIVALSLAGCFFCAADVAQAQTCVRDAYGRVICGERIHRYAPPPAYYDGGPEYERRYRRSRPNQYGEDGSQDCYTYRGRRICCPHQWTVQDGTCKPYSGR